MNGLMPISQDKPKTAGRGIFQSVKEFGSLLWRFSKKLMWFSSTSKYRWG